MRFFAIIPARGGSKRIPGKNAAPCAGKPLLAWTAEAALGSARLDGAFLSTDDSSIALLGQSLGLEVPFVRPEEAATDNAPMIAVLQHFVASLDDIADGDAIVLLQPTSPLRSASHIDAAIELFEVSDTTSLVSVCLVPHPFHPLKTLKIEDGRLQTYLPEAPAQGRTHGAELPPAYGRNGPAILISKSAVIASGELYGDETTPYIMEPEDSVDIDEPFDLTIADAILRNRATRKIFSQ
jgi:CMP-N,N'-diacetyllegionaminic acid synthase